MFINYLKLAFRNIKKKWGYSFINIAGLAIGMASCIHILFWVFDELNFDRFHKDISDIYKINSQFNLNSKLGYNTSTPFPLTHSMIEYPEIKHATNFRKTKLLVKFKDKVFTEENGCFTDSSFFSIFSFEFLKKNVKTPLSNSNTIIVTENIAKKYFGEVNAIGQILHVNNKEEYVVTGVIKNIPSNSAFQFELFIPYSLSDNPIFQDDWSYHYEMTYVKLRKHSSIQHFAQKLKVLAEERLPNEKISFIPQALSKIHLYSIKGEPTTIKYVYIFTLIAIFILLIACINYMNLSTAHYIQRIKEVGLRKVIGAKKSQIIIQFLSESIIYAILSLIIAFILVELFQPVFNQITGKFISIDYTGKMLRYFFFSTIIIGLIAGIYPALYISSFQPIIILKGTFRNNRKSKINLRKFLVVTQFTLAIILMICTGIIYSQINFIKNKKMGFDKENLIYLDMNAELSKKFKSFKTELIKNPEIESITRTSELPNNINAVIRGITWAGKESDDCSAFGFLSVDYGYFETMNMKIQKGRSFSKNYASESSNVIINETAAKTLRMANPLGQCITMDDQFSMTVIGITNNFNSMPLQNEYKPVIMMIYPDFHYKILIKINSKNISETLNKIEKNWKQFSPGFPFEHHFFDEDFDQLYRNEVLMGKILGYFVILAIIISCLGVFGLMSFTTEQRKKEIGVRKVQGATASSIIALLSKELTNSVLVANFVAWPIAYFAMNKWLQYFAFRTRMNLGVFIGSSVIVLVIASLTVSYQAVKASNTNPVDSLRYE